MQSTCLTCNSIVVPKRRMNWLLLILLNVFYLPIYFLSKKRCPNCKGKDFAPAEHDLTAMPSTTLATASDKRATARQSDAQQMIDVMYDVRRIGVQAMESAYIVATSKTVDTVVSRFEFLSELHMGLVTQCTTPTYSLHAQQAIDQFKAIRYNTLPEAYQMQLLTNPMSFDLPKFYAAALQDVARRSAAAHIMAIQSLKKDDAKQKRLAKIRVDLQTCIGELDAHCQAAGSYAEVKEQLEAAVRAIDSGNLPQLGSA